MKSPENILFLMTDQQPANSLGCYGNSYVTTPFANQLAAEGVRFDCNLSNSPVCMAARASLLTGRSPEAHGVFRNGLELREGALPLFSEVLRERGYRTVWSGKHHWKCQMDGIPAPGLFLGFEEHYFSDDNQMGPYFDHVAAQGKEYWEMVVGTLFNLPPQGHPFWKDREYISQATINKMRAKHIEPRMPGPDKSINFWVSPLPDELTQNAWIADRAIEAIKRHRNERRPFFIAASFVDPHDPYNPSEKFFATVDPSLCPPPRCRLGEHAKSPPHFQKYVRGETEHPWVNRVVRQTAEEWKMLRACYFAKVNAVDFHMSRIRKALEEEGMLDSTSVVLTSDHGDMMGDHGMITKGDFHYDSCIRTPLIIRPAGGASSRVCQQPTGILDLFPTFVEMTGEKAPSDILLEGKSLGPILRGGMIDDREFSVSEIFATVDGSHHPSQWAKTLRNNQWRLSWFPGQSYGQLFDLQKDPDEFENLWDEPSYRHIREELTQKLFDCLTTRCAPLPTSKYPV